MEKRRLKRFVLFFGRRLLRIEKWMNKNWRVGGGSGCVSSFCCMKESVECCAGIGFLFPMIQNMFSCERTNSYIVF